MRSDLKLQASLKLMQHVPTHNLNSVIFGAPQMWAICLIAFLIAAARCQAFVRLEMANSPLQSPKGFEAAPFAFFEWKVD